MIREAFCTTCIRTVYRSQSDDDDCPVCMTALVLVRDDVEPAPDAPPPSDLIPSDEPMRLAAVRRYRVLDTPADGSFDRIARLATRMFGVQIATISIVDRDRIWFKAKQGLTAEEIGRDPGLCASAILNDEPWVVNDARIDPRTLDNPLVRGELGLRFYAGAPLMTADGYNLGTINVIDPEPRSFSDIEAGMLGELAQVVVDALELRLLALRLASELN